MSETQAWSPMQILSTKGMKDGFGWPIDLAHTEPVAEVKNKLPVVVVMAIDEYERLKTLDTAESLKRK